MRGGAQQEATDLAFRTLRAGQVSQLVVARRDGSQIEVVHETAALIEAPNWSPDGRWLVFNSAGRLYRIAADGAAAPQAIDSAPIEELNNDHVISPCGRWIYASNADGHIYRLPFTGGTPERISNDHHPAFGFRYYVHGVSPDNSTLCFVGLERRGHRVETRVCTIPSVGGDDRVLTDGACPVDAPDFSPCGKWIWFNSEAAATAPGHAQIFRMRPDGSGLMQVTHDARVNWFPHVAPNGQVVAYLSYPAGTEGHPPDRDVIIRTMKPDGSSQRDIDSFNGGQGSMNVPSWAPNSRAFAYVRYPVSD